MDNSVYWMLEVSIKEGKYDEFTTLMNDMVEATERDEPGVLNYEWSINESKDKCHIYERYKDSEATMTHLGNFGKNFSERFMAVLAIDRFTYYGKPNQLVIDTLSNFGAKHMSYFGGFIR